MKQRSIIILAVLCLMMATPACNKDFLDEKVYSSYAPSTLRDELGFEASLVGLYNHLSQFYTYSDRQGWLNVWQVGTDIAYAGQQEGIEVPKFAKSFCP